MKRNSENGCDFLKFTISVRSGHCAYRPLSLPGHCAYPARSPNTSLINSKCLPVTLCGQLLYVRNTQSMLQSRAFAVGTLIMATG